MKEVRHIPLKDAARFLRNELVWRWPLTKFSVQIKRHSGGGNIFISWKDGPSILEVQAVADPYSSARWDALCDGTYYVKSWLHPEGSAIIASKADSATMNDELTDPPTEHSELVQFAGSRPSYRHY